MPLLARFTKQPAEVLDYDVDFNEWIGEDSIESFTVHIDPPTGLTLEGSSALNNVVKVLLSGGASGDKYKITVRATTVGNLVKEADFGLSIREI